MLHKADDELAGVTTHRYVRGTSRTAYRGKTQNQPSNSLQLVLLNL